MLIAIILSVGLIQCNSSSDNSTIADEKNYTANDIEGNWTLINTEIIEEKQSITQYNETAEPEIIREWSPPVYVDGDGILRPHSEKYYLSSIYPDMDIREDSIYKFNYPIELVQRNAYVIDSSLLKIGDNPKGKIINLSSNKDTLKISYLDIYGLYLEETYQKTTYNDSILDILKLYKTNFPLLAGTWKLIREEDVGWGQTYRLIFPYEIPDSIVLTEEELITSLFSDRSCQMMTDDKKRKYFLAYDGAELQLIPDDWYDPYTWYLYGEGDNPYIHFRRIDEE